MNVLKHIIIPVADLDVAVARYAGLGFALKFRDGDRFAALDGGAITLGLVSGDEDIASGRMALSILVPDLDQAVTEAEEAGLPVVLRPQSGPHEDRAVIEDGSGNAIILYRKS